MRPYQITATERILNRIEIANNYKKYGDIAGGGYIWHTTGSGKTLTSFKTARQASLLPYIDKVLFVVDRKDLDYQTMKEYDRFEKGAANSNTSTAILKKQLEDSNAHIIITTIQKLATFIKKNKVHEVYNKHVVIIFDECHRSQFGDMHSAIVKSFKKYHLFGFTGTPIFPANTGSIRKPQFFTTEQTFGDQLHTYTIVDAINDKNVLPFRVDYVKTMDMGEDIDDEQVWDIAREKAMMAPERIRLVTEYILNNFDRKTYRGDKTYIYNTLANISEVASGKNGAVEEIKQKQRVSGFNSIFAVASVPMAKLYYQEFKKQMEADPTKKLRIATIYSYGANEAEYDEGTSGILDEENSEDTSALDQSSRDFLESAIKDYNEMFHTNYSTDSDKFQNYYKDVSLRMKNKELDLLIVVNMFLTGFDATTLNTLWVDKNLKMHGLIQAFSRTNRILNSIKTFGNIVCFRNLQKRVDTAISLFGDKNAGGIVLMIKLKSAG
jgi:type I restriction enzyme R subunit